MEDVFQNVQINITDLPDIEELEFSGLEKRYFYIMLFNSSIFYFLLLIAASFIWYTYSESHFQYLFYWFLFAILAVYLGSLSALKRSFVNKAYAFRQKDICYKSGWLWKSITTIPFNRVQHCEVSQGVFDRYLGLSKLKIFTAGGNSSDVSIPGLKLEEANDLKHFILNKVKEDE